MTYAAKIVSDMRRSPIEDIAAIADEIRVSYWLPPERTARAVMAILQARGWQKRRQPPSMANDIKRAVASLKAAGKIGDSTPAKMAHKLVMRELGIDPATPPYGLQSSEGVRRAMRAAGIGWGPKIAAKDGGDAESNTGS